VQANNYFWRRPSPLRTADCAAGGGMEIIDSENSKSGSKKLEKILGSKKFYIATIFIWAALGGLSFHWRMASHKQVAERRAEQRGQSLCQVILAAHTFGPRTGLTSGSFSDNSFISNLNIDQTKNPHVALSKATYTVATSIPGTRNFSSNPDLMKLLEDPDVASQGHLNFSLSKSPSSATFFKPIVTSAACIKCHSGSRVSLAPGRAQLGIEVSYPTSDLLLEYQNYRLSNIFADIAIFSLLCIASILALRIFRSYHFNLQATTSQIIQSEKMASLGLMVAGFSHELKTPIGIAVGASLQITETTQELMGIFSKDEVDIDEIMEPLNTLNDSSILISTHLGRAHVMIQKFKSTASDLSFADKQSFELLHLFEDLQTDMRHLHKNVNININISCPPDLTMYASISVIKQIIYNLYTNAIKYAFLDGTIAGTISIECSQSASNIHIIFSDNGCGMPEDVLEHIFDPFYTTNRDTGGTGLGMFIVYSLVTRTLKGTIKCRSKLGSGTRVELRFPPGKPEDTLQ
jgi:signal transduction histidine kinase